MPQNSLTQQVPQGDRKADHRQQPLTLSLRKGRTPGYQKVWRSHLLKFWTPQASSSPPQTMAGIQDTREVDHTRPHLKWGMVSLPHFHSGTLARKPSTMPQRQRRLRSSRGTSRGKAHQWSHTKDYARMTSGPGTAPLFLLVLLPSSCPHICLPAHPSVHSPLAVFNAVHRRRFYIFSSW